MGYVTPEQQIQTALANDAGVAAIAGSNITGGLLPRNEAAPAGIRVTRVSTTRTEQDGSYTLDQGYTGFCWGRFQIDCFAVDYPTSVALAVTVRLVISRMDLTGGGNSQANMILQERDLPEPNMIMQFRRALDAKVWFTEESRNG